MTNDTLSVTQTTKGKLPRLPFSDMKDAILGKKYTLSLVFVGDTRAKSLNETYRKKDYIPDVLSFPITKDEGEIFINPLQAKRQMKKFNMPYKTMLGFLFIHGLLHLKGHPHGSTMDTLERKYLSQFLNT